MGTEQQTLAKPARMSGVGLHSGKPVNMTVLPAPPNHGIRFKRVDLPSQPVISALFRNVVDTSLATVLGADGVIVSTIEHLMASFAGLGIDNALVEIDNYELPIADGSAGPFTEMILEAGIAGQGKPRVVFMVKEPITLSENDRSVLLEPADGFEIHCTIDFPHPMIREQAMDLLVTADTFSRHIARARTFGFLQEIDLLKRYGFAKGGSLDNAVVLDAEGVVNEGGLRWPDEFVRHKILDCLGDFSLLGIPIQGRISITKSGHAFNHSFLEQFFACKQNWETTTQCAPGPVSP